MPIGYYNKAELCVAERAELWNLFPFYPSHSLPSPFSPFPPLPSPSLPSPSLPSLFFPFFFSSRREGAPLNPARQSPSHKCILVHFWS